MFSNADWKIKKITAPISWLPLAPQQPQLCDLLSKLYYHLSKWQNRKTVQGCRYRVRFIWKLHLSTWDLEYICPSITVQVSTGKKKKTTQQRWSLLFNCGQLYILTAHSCEEVRQPHSEKTAIGFIYDEKNSGLLQYDVKDSGGL